MSTTTAPITRTKLTGLQLTAAVMVANTVRPDWADTGAAIITLERVNKADGFPAASHAEVLQALVRYATATISEEDATEDRPAGSPQFRTPSLFVTPGWWWGGATGAEEVTAQ